MRKFFNHLFAHFTSLLLLAFAGQSGYVHAQFRTLSRPVKLWALLHPVAALKVQKMQDECSKFYDKKEIRSQLDTFSSGGKLDAYRHVFNMAAYAREIKIKKIRKLGQAHERGNYMQFKKQQHEEGEVPDSLSTVMDLHNNELGFEIGSKNRRLDLPELSNIVIEKIHQGKAVIFKRNASGRYVDCSGNVIRADKFRGAWYIPKCLVPSDYTYIP